jgi:NADP-dependent 3-hydroxy acid dehydrogenase YdfG
LLDVTRLLSTAALVTGASSGIGAATARALAAEGAGVALVARRRDRLEGLAAEIAAAGGRALVIEADVSSREQVDAAVGTAVAHFGRLDTVVANAGVMLLGPVADAPFEEWDRMISLNISGLLYTARAAIPHLLESAERQPRAVADLVLISSGAGRRVHAGSAVYSATKHAVGALGEALRQELARRFVRVSLIEPGNTDSELAGHLRPEILAAAQARFGDMTNLAAEDIADCIAYVVSRARHIALNEVLIRPTDQV